jgi:hypothetical protein
MSAIQELQAEGNVRRRRARSNIPSFFKGKGGERMTLSVGDKLAKVFEEGIPPEWRLVRGEAEHIFEVERIDWINEGAPFPSPQHKLLVKLKVVE